MVDSIIEPGQCPNRAGPCASSRRNRVRVAGGGDAGQDGWVGSGGWWVDGIPMGGGAGGWVVHVMGSGAPT